MAFYQYQSKNLVSFFDTLYQLIKSERRNLPPQKVQTIVVGNLDTEAFVRRKFLDRDGILMGVDFPFLETAIESFLNNQGSSETATTPQKTPGMLEFEVILGQLICDKEHTALWGKLGYTPESLTPLQQTVLAQKLAVILRDYLLHIPAAMQNFLTTKTGKNQPPIGSLWKMVYEVLKTHNFASALIDGAALATTNTTSNPSPKTSLYLFGMPVLSMFHITALSQIARVTDVHFFSVTTAIPETPQYAELREKLEAYQSLFRQTVIAGGAAWNEKEIHVAPGQSAQPEIQIWAVPGAWRGAELCADLWHKFLQEDATLLQPDITVALTDPANTLAAFDRACSMRAMTAHSRSRVLKGKHPLIDLLKIFAGSAGDGLSRESIIQYLENPAVTQIFNLDKETRALYVRALEVAQGYRNDYPGEQEVFNLNAAISRLKKGFLITARAGDFADLPASVNLREFDDGAIFQNFLICLNTLLVDGLNLSRQTGKQLFASLFIFFQKTGLTAHALYAPLETCLKTLAELVPETTLSLTQLVRILQNHVNPPALPDTSGIEGILFSAHTGTAFTARHITLFDLNERLDKMDDEPAGLLEEYLKAPSRLTYAEQLAIVLWTATYSGCQTLTLAYSGLDPSKGADLYPAHELEKFKSALSVLETHVTTKEDFPATILHAGATAAPLAADDDARTIELLQSGNGKRPKLSESLLPETATENPGNQIAVSDLVQYLANPAYFLLKRLGTATEKPVEFRRDEPRLSVSDGARMQFCENYVTAVLIMTATREPASPLQFLDHAQRSGQAAPAGFDHMRSILKTAGNTDLLQQFALQEKSQMHTVEYILRADLSNHFSVFDTPRFERRYLPAPKIAGIHLTGSLGAFHCRKDSADLYLLQSAVWPQRTINLVRMYLGLAVLIASGAKEIEAINLAQHDFEESKTKDLEAEFSVVGRIQSDAIPDAQDYLARLIASFSGGAFIWFDLETLQISKKLGSFATATPDAIHQALGKEAQKALKTDFIRHFYALQPDEQSFNFFDQFIRPVAAADVPAEKKIKRKKND